MGENYYAKVNICECCHKPEKELHIGKSSGGWVFTLHSIPENNLTTWPAWKLFLNRDNVVIYDEYDRIVPFDEFNDIVTNREGIEQEYPFTLLGDTYTSFEDDCIKAGGVPGPNNLVRHELGRFCVKHGEGTWDLVEGDFS